MPRLAARTTYVRTSTAVPGTSGTAADGPVAAGRTGQLQCRSCRAARTFAAWASETRRASDSGVGTKATGSAGIRLAWADVGTRRNAVRPSSPAAIVVAV